MSSTRKARSSKICRPQGSGKAAPRARPFRFRAALSPFASPSAPERGEQDEGGEDRPGDTPERGRWQGRGGRRRRQQARLRAGHLCAGARGVCARRAGRCRGCGGGAAMGPRLDLGPAGRRGEIGGPARLLLRARMCGRPRRPPRRPPSAPAARRRPARPASRFRWAGARAGRRRSPGPRSAVARRRRPASGRCRRRARAGPRPRAGAAACGAGRAGVTGESSAGSRWQTGGRQAAVWAPALAGRLRKYPM